MRTNEKILLLCSAFACGLEPVSFAGDWRMSVGPVWRGGMEMRASGSSYAQDSSLRPTPGGVDRSTQAWQTHPPWSGDDGSAYADRDFDDGFVYMDPSTAQNGDTWYWGYRDAGQYNAAADTLTFGRSATLGGATYHERMHSATTFDVPLSASDTLSGMGLELALERALLTTGRVRLALGFGFDAVWGMSGSVEATTLEGTATRQWVEYGNSVRTDSAYVYDLMGVVPPTAPYSGTYDGPGPIIPNRPAAVSHQQSTAPGAEHVQSSTSSQGRNQVRLNTDAALYELWAGPTLGVQAGSRVRLSVRPQVSLNLIDARVERHESWLEAGASGAEHEVSAWDNRESKTTLTPGGGLHGAVAVHLGKGWSAGVAAGYDWLLDDSDLTVGPNQVSLDLSGYTLSAQLGRQF